MFYICTGEAKNMDKLLNCNGDWKQWFNLEYPPINSGVGASVKKSGDGGCGK